MKIVDLQKLWNYVVNNFFIWNHLIMQNYVWISQIWNLNVSNDLGWKNFLNENYRSRKVMKRCSWPLFDLNSFKASNKQFTLGLPSAFFLALGKDVFCRVPLFWHSAKRHFAVCIFFGPRQISFSKQFLRP